MNVLLLFIQSRLTLFKRRIVFFFFLSFQHVTYSRCSFSISICGIIERLYVVAAGPTHSPLIMDILFEGHTSHSLPEDSLA